MVKKILILGVALIMCIGIFNGCEYKRSTDEAQNGVYFEIGRGSKIVVVYEEKLSVFFSGQRCDVFEFTKDSDAYISENIRARATIKFINDELRIALLGINGYSVPSKNLHLKRNAGIGLSDEEPIKLDSPNILPSRDPIFNIYTGLSWDFEEGHHSSLYLHQNGILGARVEIKRPNSENFVLEKIRDYIPEPACFFDIHFPDLNLRQGINVLKIQHLGGPFMNSDNRIQLSIDSDAIYFNITVDSDGNVTTVEIQE